jgi:peptidoglycan-N-acetylglucosamine deacetylase
MLKFHRIIVLFAIIMVLTIVSGFFTPIHYLVYVSIAAIPVIIVVFGSARVCSGLYLESYCTAKNKGRVLGLTFDDGPDSRTTPLILDILKEHDIHAAFFCTGEKAEKDPGLIRRIDSEGHIIGNHSYSHHFFFDLFSEKKMTSDVMKSDSVVSGILGKKMKLFRPPYGVTNPVLARVLKKSGHRVIGWSLKSYDTKNTGKEKLLKRLVSKIRSGGIILFHDDRILTAEVLHEFINAARSKNYRFERPDWLLNIEPYE